MHLPTVNRHRRLPFAAWVGLAACLVPAAAWAGSTVTGQSVVGPAPAEAAAERPAVAPSTPVEQDRSGWLLLHAAEQTTFPAERVPGDESRAEVDRGPQVVPLPPTFYPGLVLIGLAFLRVRK